MNIIYYFTTFCSILLSSSPIVELSFLACVCLVRHALLFSEIELALLTAATGWCHPSPPIGWLPLTAAPSLSPLKLCCLLFPGSHDWAGQWHAKERPEEGGGGTADGDAPLGPNWCRGRNPGRRGGRGERQAARSRGWQPQRGTGSWAACHPAKAEGFHPSCRHGYLPAQETHHLEPFPPSAKDSGEKSGFDFSFGLWKGCGWVPICMQTDRNVKGVHFHTAQTGIYLLGIYPTRHASMPFPHSQSSKGTVGGVCIFSVISWFQPYANLWHVASGFFDTPAGDAYADVSCLRARPTCYESLLSALHV